MTEEKMSSATTLDTAATPIANRTPAGATEITKFHASLNVSDLKRSVKFYEALFGAAAVKHYEDYAKFELMEPPLVLSLKPKRAHAGGPLNHLGIRLTNIESLEECFNRVKAVGARVGKQDDVQCCYARQTKLWITDPDGTLWEVYVLHDDVPDWGEKHRKIKLWSAPLKAFGIRGMILRWLNNAFGDAAKSDDQSSVAFESPIPQDACTVREKE